MDNSKQFNPQTNDILQNTIQLLETNQKQFQALGGDATKYSINDRIEAIRSVMPSQVVQGQAQNQGSSQSHRSPS